MALRGDLASVDLAQVFQMLALNQKVGLLSIQSRQSWKVLAFDNRGVSVHHNVHAVLERVVAGLVRTGRLAPDALEEVRDHAQRTGQSLTDGLLAGGYLDTAELEDQYRIALEEEIYELFFCRDARFEFYEHADHLDGYDGHTDPRFFFHCDSIVMEAARRIDEWAYIVERVPATDMFFVAAADSISVEEFGLEGAAVFELLDGRRSVQRLIEMTGLVNFQACKAIAQMLDAGAIAPVADEDLIDFAAECEGEGRASDAIELYERAASLGLGGAPVHALAAKAYRAAGRFADAGRHLEAEAELLAEQGDVQGAARKLLELKEMLPTALGVRERLVELMLRDGVELPGCDAMAEGKEVVDLLLAFGDVERVRRLLELLLQAGDGDVDLKKALVSVHIKAGDQQRVAELYESIADDLVEQGHPLEAVGYLQKILLMDRSRSDISERVRRLYERDEHIRQRRRLLGLTGTVLLILVASGVFYWFYDQRAAEEFKSIDVTELMAHDDFAGAAMTFTEFMRHFPLSTSIAGAEAELRRIEAERQKFEAQLTAERAVQQRELQRIRTNYRRDWERHRELFLGGEPEKALEVLGGVREQVAAAGAQADVEWAFEQELERSWQRLSDYLAEAGRLAEGYDEAAAAQQWEQARTIALKLKREYENTAAAHRVAVPVTITTRPAGARLMQQGQPLQRIVDGKSEALLTPTVVLCAAADQVLELQTDMPGFEPRKLEITPRDQASVDVVLAVVPAQRITFPERLQTGLGLGSDWLAVGLRGGQLGAARLDGSGVRAIALPGLRAVESTPLVRGGRAFFISNEDTIESIQLEEGRSAPGWPVPLPNGAATELVADSGRLAVIDRESVLHCWELSSGSHLWGLSLDGQPSGPPTIHRRNLVVGTTDGRVYVVDVTDGSTLGVLRSGDGISTRILTDGQVIVFGCSNGDLRVVEVDTGRVKWNAHLAGPIVDGTITLGDDLVCVATGGRLSCWSRDGAELGNLELVGTARSGLQIAGGRLYVQTSLERERNKPLRNVLQAFDAGSRAVLWEFNGEATEQLPFGLTDLAAAFPATDDTVVLFR